MKKYAVVEIKGGLGNQIFQYSFGCHLEKKGFKVLYNLEFYMKDFKSNTEREFLLDELDFELKRVGKVFQRFINFLNFLVNSKKLKPLVPFLKSNLFKYFKERDFQQNIDFHKYPIFNYFDGYWQNNESYLLAHKDRIYSSLKVNGNAPRLEKIMIHVRRDDYLDLGVELPIEYYKNALEVLEKKIGEMDYDIFTDDFTWVDSQDLFKNSKNIYTNEDDTITTFLNMMQYKHYIIANSTYSYLAAFFGEIIGSEVLMPYRWNKNKSEDFLTTNHWTKVKF